MEKDKIKTFSTPDRYFASGLATIADKIEIPLPFYLKEVNGRGLYVFEATSEFYKIASLYNENELVGVLSVFEKFRKISGMLYTMKTREGLNGK